MTILRTSSSNEGFQRALYCLWNSVELRYSLNVFRSFYLQKIFLGLFWSFFKKTFFESFFEPAFIGFKWLQAYARAVTCNLGTCLSCLRSRHSKRTANLHNLEKVENDGARRVQEHFQSFFKSFRPAFEKILKASWSFYLAFYKSSLELLRALRKPKFFCLNISTPILIQSFTQFFRTSIIWPASK